MLAIFALSQPTSAQLQDAKRWIGRLIKIPRQLGNRTAISDQSGHLLEKLLRLILEQEIKILTDDKEFDNTSHLAQIRGGSTSPPSHALNAQLTGGSDYVLTASNMATDSVGVSQQGSRCRTANATAPGVGLWNTQHSLDTSFDYAPNSLTQGATSSSLTNVLESMADLYCLQPMTIGDKVMNSRMKPRARYN